MLFSLFSLNSLRSLLLGIVFDTYVGEGASVEVRGYPPLCWVLFSIPMFKWARSSCG